MMILAISNYIVNVYIISYTLIKVRKFDFD
jgi:hypothetical protein